MESRLINASRGGSLCHMTTTKIQEWLENLIIESKHSRNDDEWYADQPQGVKEFSAHHPEPQISELKNAVLLLTKENVAAKKQCGIFLKIEHPTDICPLFLEDIAVVKSVGGYQQNFQSIFLQRQ